MSMQWRLVPAQQCGGSGSRAGQGHLTGSAAAAERHLFCLYAPLLHRCSRGPATGAPPAQTFNCFGTFPCAALCARLKDMHWLLTELNVLYKKLSIC